MTRSEEPKDCVFCVAQSIDDGRALIVHEGTLAYVIMTTADDEATKAILDERGYEYIEGESLVTEVDDKPGGMARLSRALADAGVNIYGHLFLGRWGDRAMFAFVVDKPEIARPILERKG